MDIKIPLVDFLEKISNEKITANTKILDEGIVDSLQFFELIAFLENEFNVVFNDEDLDIKNFHSLDTILNLIKIKINS